jgi:2-polyprenyl-3-methyl-5-hydroxy-6-metoxy-1,4-benzoquinol methylase
LDAGSGIGVLAKAMSDAGANVTAVDVSPTAVETARALVPSANFECMPLEKITFASRFDAVVCMDVLFHVVDDARWRQVLSRLYEAAKPGGFVIIQEAFAEAVAPHSEHVRWRTLGDYQSEFAHLQVETYTLPSEGSEKTILTVQKR